MSIGKVYLEQSDQIIKQLRKRTLELIYRAIISGIVYPFSEISLADAVIVLKGVEEQI